MVATSSKSPLSVDSLLEKLGIVGRYQVLQATWQFLSNLTIAFQLLNVVFIAQDVQHQCAKSEVWVSDGVSPDVNNITDYGKCHISRFNSTTNTTTASPCYTWEYVEGKHHSIVSEWDLVCESVALSRLPQSLFVAGQGVGALVFSILSDKFGRKPFLLLCHIFTGGLGFALAFSPNIQAFMALRMLNGAFQQGVVVTLSTMILEIFPRNRRVEVATVSAIVWSVCPVLLTLVAFLLRHEIWGTLQLAFSAMSLCVILQLIFVDESLRWLITNNKEEQATAILKKAAKQNNVDVASVLSLYSTSNTTDLEPTSNEKSDPKQDAKETSEAGQYTFLDIFRSKLMLKISLIVWVTWMVDSLTYFSLYLTAESLADDLYLNFFLNSVAEVPTGFLFWILSRRIGRRKFFMLFHTISGVCLLIATAIRSLADGDAASTGATVFAFIGKVGSATCFTSLFVYVPEIYPTNLRTAGLGAGSTAARVGAAMAPFTSMLVAAIPWLPGTIFGAACLFVAALGILLPEPEGRELPETIQDIASWDNTIPSHKD